MPKIGGKRKKSRTHKEDEEDSEIAGQTPRTFIIRRGQINRPLKEVLKNMREVMHPYTAIKLQDGEKIKIKQYLNAAGIYKISHMIIFTSTEKSNFMRLIKTPEGPTLTFKILNYSTCQDIIDAQRPGKQKIFSRSFDSPLLIMNGFNFKGEGAQNNATNPRNYDTVSLMLQSMFPALNIYKTEIHNLKRVALFSLDQEKDVIDFRHYHIKAQPTNITKSIKKIINARRVPNLSKFNDISELVLNKKKLQSGGYTSESDMEDIPENKIEVDQKSTLSKGTFKVQNAIKLYETGPRLKLKLFKVQEGFLGGNVIYHRLIQKNAKEILEQTIKIKQKKKGKEQAKQQLQKKLKQKKFKEEQQSEDENENQDNEQQEQEEEEKVEQKPKKKVKLQNKEFLM